MCHPQNVMTFELTIHRAISGHFAKFNGRQNFPVYGIAVFVTLQLELCGISTLEWTGIDMESLTINKGCLRGPYRWTDCDNTTSQLY